MIHIQIAEAFNATMPKHQGYPRTRNGQVNYETALGQWMKDVKKIAAIFSQEDSTFDYNGWLKLATGVN